MSEAHYQREVEWYETLLTQKSKKIVELETEIERLSQVLENVQEARFLQGKAIVDASNEMERLRADQREADEEFSLLQNDLGQALIEIENLRLALEVAANDLHDWGAYTKANSARAALDGK